MSLKTQKLNKVFVKSLKKPISDKLKHIKKLKKQKRSTSNDEQGLLDVPSKYKISNKCQFNSSKNIGDNLS